MLYKFKSKADSDLFMNQGPAERILTIIGKEPGAQGIIEPEAMAEAIARLQAAVAEEDRLHEAQGGAARGVTLQQRAWPFLQLLRRSLDADEPIVWGV